MGQPLSIENGEWVYLITTRTSGSRLWFVNNKKLEAAILAALARYQEVYGVMIYGFVLMGNHYHLLARFPGKNRAQFMRDFNSAVARLVGRYVGEHGRRSVWARRYSWQALLRDEDVNNWFYYLALNPVSSGIVSDIKQYSSYNSYFTARDEIKSEFTWIDWSKYILTSRSNKKVKPEDFSKKYILEFTRLPNRKQLTKEQYIEDLNKELERREGEIVKERRSRGKGFLGAMNSARQKVGSVPVSTKRSNRHSKRPLILTLCSETRRYFLSVYFSIKDRFADASKAYREGHIPTIFPIGTYPPHLPAIV